jgi:hypothetical protein
MRTIPPSVTFVHQVLLAQRRAGVNWCYVGPGIGPALVRPRTRSARTIEPAHGMPAKPALARSLQDAAGVASLAEQPVTARAERQKLPTP